VLLTPENEAASGLSTVEGASGPITKVRVIADTPAAFRKIEASEPTIAKASKAENSPAEPIATIESLDDLRKKREATKASEVSKIDSVVDEIDEVIVENDVPLEIKAEPEVDDSPDAVFDDESPKEDLAELFEQEQGIDEVDEAAPEVDEVTEAAPAVEERPVDSASDQQTTKKPRAAMPSWDQIVFGTKSED
jgi:hypothetical protein